MHSIRADLYTFVTQLIYCVNTQQLILSFAEGLQGSVCGVCPLYFILSGFYQ